jgi:hypothetical protein
VPSCPAGSGGSPDTQPWTAPPGVAESFWAGVQHQAGAPRRIADALLSDEPLTTEQTVELVQDVVNTSAIIAGGFRGAGRPATAPRTAGSEGARSSLPGGRPVLYNSRQGRPGDYVGQSGDWFPVWRPNSTWTFNRNMAFIDDLVASRRVVGDSMTTRSGRLVEAPRGSVLAAERQRLRDGGYNWNRQQRQWEPPDE